MKIIKRKFLEDAARAFPRAAEAIAEWLDVVRVAKWKNRVEMKQAISGIDPVKVKRGRTVYVCNIRRNEYRLLIAVHFNRGKVYTLRFFTHKDYDNTDWKNEL